VAFPCPAHRRTYALGPAPEAARPARRAAVLPQRPIPASILEPMEAEPLMEPMDEIVFAPEPTAPWSEPQTEPTPEEVPLAAPPARSRPRRRRPKVVPVPASRPSRLLPVRLALLGAAGAWFGGPLLLDRMVSLGVRVPVERLESWMLAAAGFALGLALGGVWLGWRAARR
jgi:hypothetical protein